MERENIRNFSIIAHIDHGKSTLADRLIEWTQTVDKRKMQEQLLDDMDLERERGITIKAHPLTMRYQSDTGKSYCFNLIDTPGHVDFSYEVSRSLAACEGALLVVDATQGIQAQTLAHLYLAIEKGLKVLPVVNKIDLPAADSEGICRQIEELLGVEREEVLFCSAKSGEGIEQLLKEIVAKIPPPPSEESKQLQALIFDSHYDSYRGALAYVRLMNSELQTGDQVVLMSSGKVCEVQEVGIFAPDQIPQKKLKAGEVGYVILGIKTLSEIQIGDTITLKKNPAIDPLSGFSKVLPVVFAGIYPLDGSDLELLREALAKLQLNDAALSVESESNSALGHGFRCGFLGLLHLEITFERIRREFSVEILMTSPSVVYHVYLKGDSHRTIDNPNHLPDPSTIHWIEEPWAISKIIVPNSHVGSIMNLSTERRGECVLTENLDDKRVLLTYHFPLSEILTDFSDQLKSVTQGYGSFNYEISSHRRADIVKLEILVNGEVIPPFSTLVLRKKAEAVGRELCGRLQELIPRQQFQIPIQACIGRKVIARKTLSALKKHVTAKCYGGDITRKRKLWEKQKRGKERMKKFGKVRIPQEAFIKMLKKDM